MLFPEATIPLMAAVMFAMFGSGCAMVREIACLFIEWLLLCQGIGQGMCQGIGQGMRQGIDWSRMCQGVVCLRRRVHKDATGAFLVLAGRAFVAPLTVNTVFVGKRLPT